jgi:hypothetical protein
MKTVTVNVPDYDHSKSNVFDACGISKDSDEGLLLQPGKDSERVEYVEDKMLKDPQARRQIILFWMRASDLLGLSQDKEPK